MQEVSSFPVAVEAWPLVLRALGTFGPPAMCGARNIAPGKASVTNAVPLMPLLCATCKLRNGSKKGVPGGCGALASSSSALSEQTRTAPWPSC